MHGHADRGLNTDELCGLGRMLSRCNSTASTPADGAYAADQIGLCAAEIRWSAGGDLNHGPDDGVLPRHAAAPRARQHSARDDIEEVIGARAGWITGPRTRLTTTHPGQEVLHGRTGASRFLGSSDIETPLIASPA
ncbi:hypothetical protein [Streptomyces sp. NPDC001792]|uniref:hypothetical protein n=1 Tax=unclassified Streptomyces TaxID=2593676 RepID=UPI00331A1C90